MRVYSYQLECGLKRQVAHWVLKLSLYYFHVLSSSTAYTAESHGTDVCVCEFRSYSQVKDQVMETFFWDTVMESN